MLTVPSGFNPVPSVSLGDTERVLEVYAESIETSGNYNPASTINMDEIISKFVLDASSVRTNTKANVIVIENPKDEPKKIVETTPKIDLDRIDSRIHKKAQEDLAKLRAELEAEKEKAAKLAAEQAKAVDEAKRLAEKQAEESRKAAEETERLRIEAEKAKVAQEMEKQRLAAEIERQKLEAEKLRAQQEAEQLRQQIAREKAAAEQARLEAQRELEKIRAAKAQAEAEEADRLARAKAEEAERIAAEAREKARAAEKAREEAEIKAKREKLEQLRRKKEEKDRQAKQQAEAKKVKASINKNVDSSKIDYYNSLDIQALFTEVKKFAQQKGLSRQIIDRKLLEDNFGKANINRLILKSYLISINKGVTFGYG